MRSNKALGNTTVLFRFVMGVLPCLVLFVVGRGHVLAGDCPKPSDMETTIKRVFKRDATVLELVPSPQEGLCEAHVKIRGRIYILYTSTSGRYVFIGHLWDASAGRNLTKEKMADLNRLSSRDMERLKGLTAFTAGDPKAPKTLFYVTDPQCPYCKKGIKEMEGLLKQGLLRVNFLLFPLSSHKGAKDQCVSIVCDGKGLDELKSGYRSKNQCPEGRKRVDDTVRFLRGKGISSTPTYIFPDGRYLSGWLREPALRVRLGLPSSKIKGGK